MEGLKRIVNHILDSGVFDKSKFKDLFLGKDYVYGVIYCPETNTYTVSCIDVKNNERFDAKLIGFKNER